MAELPNSPAAMLALMRNRSIEASPLTKWLGVDLIRCWDGEAELVIPIRNELTQHYGTVHGGILGAAVDNVCAWAAASRVGPLVTAAYTIHFLEPARGTTLRAVGRVIRAGHRTAVISAEVFMEDGQKTVMAATALASVSTIRTLATE